MREKTSPLPLSRRKRLLFWCLLLGLVSGFAWGASIVWRSTAGYFWVKSEPQGWRGHVVRPDARLGVAPVPVSVGAEITRGGYDTPVRFDAAGFRVPLGLSTPEGGARILALGCSFTFGSGVAAEEAYPWLVARDLGGHSMNAGFPGYGLAQMLPLARDLLPRYRPSLLLLQASTWLPARAARRVRGSAFDLFPVPYFAAGEGGRPEWRPPEFQARVFDLPVSGYRTTPSGILDWASFMTRVGFPLFLHDDPRRVSILTRRVTGRRPRSASPQDISALVYPEILRLCRQNGTRLVVVFLEGAGRTVFDPADLRLPRDVLVVDTKPGLYAPLAQRDAQTYLRAYGHWRGNPPKMIDDHPNEEAHALIAEQILAALRGD
jgi:hypothetical protein